MSITVHCDNSREKSTQKCSRPDNTKPRSKIIAFKHFHVVKNLPKVPTWRLEWDSNLGSSGCNAPNLPLSHHAPTYSRKMNRSLKHCGSSSHMDNQMVLHSRTNESSGMDFTSTQSSSLSSFIGEKNTSHSI